MTILSFGGVMKNRLDYGCPYCDMNTGGVHEFGCPLREAEMVSLPLPHIEITISIHPGFKSLPAYNRMEELSTADGNL